MKITVNNEREKEIIELFSEFLADWTDSDKMKELLKHAEYEFESHELDLVQIVFQQVTFKVDKKVHPIYLQSDNLTGQCKYCGGCWQGIEDENEVTVEEYEHFLKLEKEEGYHAECLRERTCVNCGNDDTFDLKDMHEGMCADCYNSNQTTKPMKFCQKQSQKRHLGSTHFDTKCEGDNQMLKPRFYYRISAKAGLAHDDKGNSVACFNQVELEGGSLIDQEQYDRLHERVKIMISKQLGIPVEFFESISQEEFDENHED